MQRITNYLVCLMLAVPVTGLGQHEHQRPEPGHQADKHGHANAHMNRQSFADLAAAFESESRDAWQKPEEVLAHIGDVRGKTVMDIGSGTGYFSFRLVQAGANVICADVDERFLSYIEERMTREKIAKHRMELRKVPYDSSTLQPGEVDVVLIVDTYHHIENRVDYFNEVRAGLKPGGKLVVVDFEKRDLPIGPPVNMKLAEHEVLAELTRAGFSQFKLDRNLLPYQYIIEAW